MRVVYRLPVPPGATVEDRGVHDLRLNRINTRCDHGIVEHQVHLTPRAEPNVTIVVVDDRGVQILALKRIPDDRPKRPGNRGPVGFSAGGDRPTSAVSIIKLKRVLQLHMNPIGVRNEKERSYKVPTAGAVGDYWLGERPAPCRQYPKSGQRQRCELECTHEFTP